MSTTTTSESQKSADEAAETTPRPEPEPGGTVDRKTRQKTPENGEPPARSPERTAKEKRSREDERVEQDRIRSLRAAGLDSLRPTFAFSGATSFGGYAAERDININVGTAARPSAMGPVPAVVLADLRACHVPGPEYDEARQRLLSTRVLVLRGAEGSGRRTTSLALLRNLVDGQIYDLGAYHDLESLSSDDRHGQCGYLLDSIPGSKVGKLTLSSLASAEHWLKRQNSYLVITVDDRTGAQYDDLERYLVDHQAPDPRQVLHSHLLRLCTELPDPLPEWLDDLRLTEQVGTVRQPSALVNLAVALVNAVKDEGSLENALEYWVRGRAVGEAQRLLRGTQQVDPELRPTEQLQRCAFLVALAVFNDAPYLPVAAAAELLAQALTAAAYPKGTPHRQIFALRRASCLTWLQGTVERRPRNDLWGQQRTERIRLCNPDLPSALLDELWHEYDAVRTPILRWLQELSVSRNLEIRVRAAQAVGKLATDNFDYVCQEVIVEWAGSHWPRQRYAAAWALEAAVRTGDVEDRVRRLLRYWCRAGSRCRKLTAVATYGTGIGADRPEEALRSLHHLARADDPEMTTIACRSVVELFLGGQSAQVLDTLQNWLADADGTARRFSIVSFVQLAYQGDDSGWPVLLPLCGEHHPRVGLMTKFWRCGLSDDYSRADAWEALWLWCRIADLYVQLREPLEYLIGTIGSADNDLRKRLDWYLKFWANHPRLPSDTAGQFYSARRKD